MYLVFGYRTREFKKYFRICIAETFLAVYVWRTMADLELPMRKAAAGVHAVVRGRPGRSAHARAVEVDDETGVAAGAGAVVDLLKDGEPLDPEVQRALHDLRAALVAAMSRTVRRGPRGVIRAVDVATGLGIDRKLAWRVVQIMQSSEPIEIVRNVPGSAGLEKCLAAAMERGLDVAEAERVREAYGAYQDVVRTHAADRGTFEAIVSRAARARGDQSDFEARRAAFRANAYIWGVQAETQLCTNIVTPSIQRDTHVDLTVLTGFAGMIRMGSNISWAIYREPFIGEGPGDTMQPTLRAEPIDEPTPIPGSTKGVPLLREFCSSPLPQLHAISSVRYPDLKIVLATGGTAGNTGAMTCFTGETIRAAIPRRQQLPHTPAIDVSLRCVTPCHQAILDVLMHRSLFENVDPKFAVHSQLSWEYESAKTMLPVHERVERLGSGLAVATTPSVPEYQAMLAHVLERIGHKAEEFDIYRVYMEYPIIPTMAVIEFPLPE